MKVSVVVVTYNHADYIDQALRSVYEQETNFEFEVIISEDASTDGTGDIVRSWRDRYPMQTRLILSEQNVRTNEVVTRGFSASRGEFVALLDGDDYWTSPLKLQHQVDCLDTDPTLSMCFCNAEIVGGGEAPIGKLWTSPDLKRRLGLKDLWHGNPFATCGSMFRRSSVLNIPRWYDDFFPVTDWPLYILFAEHGEIAFLPEAMGAYRLHDGGLYSAQSLLAKLTSMDALYRRINECLDGRYTAAIRDGHRRYFMDWTRSYLRDGNCALARASFDFARRYSPPHDIAEKIETAALKVRLLFGNPRR
jgi:glycosyltransferase involved in cell wall biosynthesis